MANVRNREAIFDKISNKDHEADINYALQHTRWFLTSLGVWPYVASNPTKMEKHVSKFMLPYCSISMFVLIIPIFFHLALRDVESTELILLLGPISFGVTDILKHFILIVHSDAIKLCIKHMETDWRRIDNESDREIALEYLKVGRGLTITCTICMYSCGLFYNILMPLCSGNIINELNETVRPLVFPGNDIFINLQKGYNYEILFFSNCVSAFFQFTVVTTIFNIASIFVTHACGQIQIVISRLENLVSSDDGECDNFTIEERIAFITASHVRVLSFSSAIDEVLREMCLMEVVSSTVIICLVEYYCITEYRQSDSVAIITYVLLLISLSFNIFIFCHVGELLKEKCQQVGKAAYMIDWYKLPGRTGLSLIMIISMGNYPRKLTAGRMIELSITTFGSIMRTSFAYLGMLQTVTES
nr:olfactory receptor 9 [Gregopimpla kuwanae]